MTLRDRIQRRLADGTEILLTFAEMREVLRYLPEPNTPNFEERISRLEGLVEDLSAHCTHTYNVTWSEPKGYYDLVCLVCGEIRDAR